MKKVFLTLLVLVSIQMSSIAQETKPGCNPKACKPGNTKVEEAVAITNLRSKTDFSQYSGARLVKRLKSAIKGVQN